MEQLNFPMGSIGKFNSQYCMGSIMSNSRAHNFCAGPSALPLEVLEEMRDQFMNFGGMSIFEISHRSKEFKEVMDEAKDLIAELMAIPSGYSILFLQGGAAHQFAMVPLNLLKRRADYLITGHWSKRALAEAQKVGDARVIFTSENDSFTRCPIASEVNVDGAADYLHMTSNNTIYGTQYSEFPAAGKVPLIADMSSDILSREFDISKFALIYAGAQKNIGPAGVTLVIVRDDLIKNPPDVLPAILRYSTHAEAGSLYNTPPVSAIYLTMLNLRWIKRQGGVAAVGRINERKAATLYQAIDDSSLYKGMAEKGSRSRMNVTFRLRDEGLTKRFIAEAALRDIVGIAGHREAQGIRVSLYNAVSQSSVDELVKFMREFEQHNAKG